MAEQEPENDLLLILEAIRREMRAGFERLGTRLDELEARLDRFGVGANARLDEFDARLQQTDELLEARMAGLNSRLGAMQLDVRHS